MGIEARATFQDRMHTAPTRPIRTSYDFTGAGRRQLDDYARLAKRAIAVARRKIASGYCVEFYHRRLRIEEAFLADLRRYRQGVRK